MPRFKKWALFVLVLSLLAGWCFSALAALVAPDIPKDPKAPIKTYGDIESWFDTAAGWVATIFWIAAVVAVFYSAYLFLFSGGDTEKTTKARQVLWYAVIAIAIGLMAYGFPAFIDSILGETEYHALLIAPGLIV